jgi:hypothetical protein
MFEVRHIMFIGSVILLFVITLVRVVITEFMFLNAGRVLHNKYVPPVVSIYLPNLS